MHKTELTTYGTVTAEQACTETEAENSRLRGPLAAATIASVQTAMDAVLTGIGPAETKNDT